MRGKLLFASYLTSLLVFWNIDIPKRAFRLYEKGDLEKAREVLDKDIEKDTLNPAGYALYAIMYSDTAYANYHIDSAYWAVNKSIAQLNTITDEDDLEDLKEYQTDSVSLAYQKDRIDSLKFEEVKEVHTIDKYNAFINLHVDAKQVPEAIDRRNHIAFEDAQRINLWQSYETYMQEYPDAKEYDLADSLYKKLLYEDLTSDKSLESYVGFLEEYPQSPYRPEIEKEVFVVQTSVNTLTAYTDFLTRYPNDSLAKVAYDRMYHVYKETYKREAFFEDFSAFQFSDSLRNAASLEADFWLPKYENERYSLIDHKGETKLITFFNSIPEDYLCSPIETDFIYGSVNGRSRIQGRNGRTIYEGEFEAADDLGYGFIRLKKGDGYTLIHKSGHLVIQEPKEQITLIDNRFIKTYSNGFYGLTSINGIPYLQEEFVMIDQLGGYIWLEKEEGIALVEPNKIVQVLLEVPLELNFKYNEIELLENGRYWVMQNGQEAILDLNLEQVIPFQNRQIYERPYGWLFEDENGLEVWHDGIPELENHLFTEVKENDRWIAVAKDSAWTLYNQITEFAPSQFDSLNFLGENMVMATRNDSTWAYFKNAKSVLMEKGWNPRLLVPQNYIKTGEQANHDFFMLSNDKNYRRIYNEYGKEILSSTYKEVTALDPNMLRLQKTNAALVDSLGVFLLDFVYDGFGSNDNGYVSILDAGKVGVINPSKRLLIKPNYTKLIEPYNDTTLKATEGLYKGFINKENEQLSGFDFDEIKYWNDTVAMVRIEDEWILHHIPDEASVYEGMLEYEILSQDEKENVLLVTKETGKGIYSDIRGEIIEPSYDIIKVLGSTKEPIYFSVKVVEEADIYVVIYYDKNGNKLFTQSLREDEYFKIACPSDE